MHKPNILPAGLTRSKLKITADWVGLGFALCGMSSGTCGFPVVSLKLSGFSGLDDIEMGVLRFPGAGVFGGGHPVYRVIQPARAVMMSLVPPERPVLKIPAKR